MERLAESGSPSPSAQPSLSEANVYTPHQSDFVILPCDLTPPSTIALSSLLNRHRSQSGSLLTSLWYEKGESELKDPDGPESVLVAYDKATTELLMIQPLEELEDELSIRMTLLAQYVGCLTLELN